MNPPPILQIKVQLTLVISTSLISIHRLSRSENLVPAWKSNNRQKKNIVEKRRNCNFFSAIFLIYL